MAMTYATVTGKITPPGDTTGVAGTLTATPMVDGEFLSFPAENHSTFGPAVADIGEDGTISQDGTPGFKIPTDVPPGTLWRLQHVPARRGPKTYLGDYEITASTDIADIVPVQLAAITETVANNIAAAAALGATNDTATASFVADSGSATAAALSATIETRAASRAEARVPGLYVPSDSALERWRFRLQAARSSVVRVACIGDSITHNTAASDTASPKWLHSYPQRLHNMFAERFGSNNPGNIAYWLPNTPDDPRFTSSGGGVATPAAFGPFNESARLIQGAEWLEFTSYVTGFRVYYMVGFGTLALSVDGGAVTTHDTSTGTNPVEYVDITGLSEATHTLRVALSAGASVWFWAVEGTLGSTGVSVSNVGRGGTTAADFVNGKSGSATGNWASINSVHIPAAPIDMTVIAFTTNDFYAARTPAQLAADVGAIVDKARAEDSDCLIVSPHTLGGLPLPGTAQADYATALRELAATKDVAHLDLAQRFPTDTAKAYSWGGLAADVVHLGDAGTWDYAQAIFDALTA